MQAIPFHQSTVFIAFPGFFPIQLRNIACSRLNRSAKNPYAPRRCDGGALLIAEDPLDRRVTARSP
jgi:hypothetical protein